MIITPTRRMSLRGGGTGTLYSWADWPELTQGSLNPDQSGDGSEDTFICMFDNTASGGNDIGQGAGLSGAQLVATQTGTIAGATGTPPCRAMDAVDDKFTFDTSVGNVCAAPNWTVMLKTNDLSGAGAATYPIMLISAATNDWIYFKRDTDAISVKLATSVLLGASFTASPNSTGIVYIAIWCDGTYVRAGWHTSKPTKWSDFAVNNRLTATTACDFTGKSFDGTVGINAYAASYIAIDVFYLITSNVCLINNAA